MRNELALRRKLQQEQQLERTRMAANLVVRPLLMMPAQSDAQAQTTKAQSKHLSGRANDQLNSRATLRTDDSCECPLPLSQKEYQQLSSELKQDL